tara:strand:+ start:1131 stop:1295 length:165 start_codon:yes stop_codon:yes gene_type:complete
MKRQTPFSGIKNALTDIQVIDVVNYNTPPLKREEFLGKECSQYQTKSTCKTYEL